MRGGATRGGTFGPANARLLSASLGSPDSPVSSVSVSLSLSLSLSSGLVSFYTSYFSVSPCPGLGRMAQPPQAFVRSLGHDTAASRLHFLAAGNLGVPGGSFGDKAKARGTNSGIQDRDTGGANEALGCRI